MPDWKEWLKKLAEFDRCDVVDVIDEAVLVAYARDIKFVKRAQTLRARSLDRHRLASPQ